MGRFADSARQAAEQVERLSRAMESLPSGGSFAGPGGGGAGGAGGVVSAVPPTIFNTTVVVPQPTRTMRGGPGGSGGAGGLDYGDIVTQAFRALGMSPSGKSSLFIKQIVDEFLRRTHGNGGVDFRASGGG